MSLRILTVDDDPASLELVVYLLKAFSHTTLVAGSAETGLRIARRELPDLVICDILLPQMDGFGLIRELKADHKLCNIPVVAVTILSGSGVPERLIAAGFNGYISKPIKVEDFVGQLENSFCAALGKIY